MRTELASFSRSLHVAQASENSIKELVEAPNSDTFLEQNPAKESPGQDEDHDETEEDMWTDTDDENRTMHI